MSGRPLDVLEASLEEDVTVLLKGGEVYAGRLAGYDQHMNLVLEPLQDPDPDDIHPDESATRSVEDTTIIRGDNVVSITP